MIGSENNNGEERGGSTLKTTTWGALIALSALLAFGVGSQLAKSHFDTSATQTAEQQASPDVMTAQADVKPAKDASFFRGAVKQISQLNPFSEGQESKPAATPTLNAQERPLVPASGLQSAAQASDPGSRNQSRDGSQTGADQDPQVLIAAKIAPDLKGIDPEKPLDVIVQFKNSASATDLTADGATPKGDLPLIHAQLVNVKGGSLSSLASHSGVAYVSPNRPVHGALDKVVTAVNGDLAYASGWDGTGVGIAVIDSGVSSVNDLNSDGNTNPSRIVYNKSYVPLDTNTGDAYGHGTHVAGIISGNAYDSQYNNYPGVYRGIAPEAKIINLRALDSTGLGTDSSVISAIQQAVALQSTYNIRVINLSLSRGVYESYTLDPLCQAVESAWKAGIVVVAAAGNMGQYNGAGTNGYATIGAPANDPYVITVGATNTHGTGSQTAQTMTSYSSKGPTAFDHIVKPDLVAPGNAVVSRMSSTGNTLVTSYPALAVYPCNSSRTSCGSQFGSARYMRLAGTSMATPVVSGTAALLLQKTPSLTPDQVKARLMKTAWKGFSSSTTATDLATGIVYSIEQDLFAVGAGAVDASAALGNTDLAPSTVGTAKSPKVTYNSSTNTVSIVSDSSVVWGNSVIWGNSVVWGNSVIWGNSVGRGHRKGGMGDK